MISVRKGSALIVGAMLALTACGGGDSGDNRAGDGTVTLTWWHNATADPLKGFWQQVADDYTASHPKVKFKVEPIQNEQFQTKMPVALQSNDPPDIFQQWGGGNQADQVKSGKVMDITDASKDWIGSLGGSAAGWQTDGKQYGVPYSLGIVGFWYDKTLFQKAGITAAPTTVEELFAAVDKLKAAGITPIAIGSKDRWPDAFYWEYFALRNCSTDTVKSSLSGLKMDDPCFVKAGQDAQKLVAAQPFQKGFLGTPAQQGAGSSAGLLANGKAAMELQGHWNPGVMSALTTDKNLNSKLGWFAFPTVSGGAGATDVQLGGGDGFSCSYKAPPECVDFLKYVVSPEVQSKFGALNVGLPVAKGSESSVSDPTLKGVLDARGASSYVQTYFDIATPTAVGQALNDAIANLFAGKATPEQVVKAFTDAAANP